MNDRLAHDRAVGCRYLHGHRIHQRRLWKKWDYKTEDVGTKRVERSRSLKTVFESICATDQESRLYFRKGSKNMDWNWTSCEIMIIQTENPYTGRVGQDPDKERRVRIKFLKPHQLIPPRLPGGSAMIEWQTFYAGTQAHYKGSYTVEWNSLNPAYHYDLGGGSDAASRIWHWSPDGTVTITNQDQRTPSVILSRATSDRRGIRPHMGQYERGDGSVKINRPILHHGPIVWERISAFW